LNAVASSALAALAVIGMFGACSHGEPQTQVVGGDRQRGRDYIERYGCGSCHVVPGVASARGQVGPPLAGIAGRAYLGGVLPNTPDYMVEWIRRPQKFAPGSAMPDLGVSEAEGRDIAAYLYTLK
jgi:cytochrome c2